MPETYHAAAAPTPEQQEVILTTEQPLLVIAGPGAGKTKTLVDRVMHLITEKHVPASGILLATFTEKAAKELVSRISTQARRQGVTVDISDMYIGTLHSIFLQMLEEYRAHTSLSRNYRVLDELRGKIQYLMIDEYQDTNRIQEQILLRLAAPRNRICVVGDDDQALYRASGVRPLRTFSASRKTSLTGSAGR